MVLYKATCSFHVFCGHFIHASCCHENCQNKHACMPWYSEVVAQYPSSPVLCIPSKVVNAARSGGGWWVRCEGELLTSPLPDCALKAPISLES